jgi:hypothetical protein
MFDLATGPEDDNAATLSIKANAALAKISWLGKPV